MSGAERARASAGCLCSCSLSGRRAQRACCSFPCSCSCQPVPDEDSGLVKGDHHYNICNVKRNRFPVRDSLVSVSLKFFTLPDTYLPIKCHH